MSLHQLVKDKKAVVGVIGLGYVGLARQRTVASTTLRGVGADAKIVVDHLRKYCQAQQRRSTTPPALWPWHSKRTQGA